MLAERAAEVRRRAQRTLEPGAAHLEGVRAVQGPCRTGDRVEQRRDRLRGRGDRVEIERAAVGPVDEHAGACGRAPVPATLDVVEVESPRLGDAGSTAAAIASRSARPCSPLLFLVSSRRPSRGRARKNVGREHAHVAGEPGGLRPTNERRAIVPDRPLSQPAVEHGRRGCIEGRRSARPQTPNTSRSSTGTGDSSCS